MFFFVDLAIQHSDPNVDPNDQRARAHFGDRALARRHGYPGASVGMDITMSVSQDSRRQHQTALSKDLIEPIYQAQCFRPCRENVQALYEFSPPIVALLNYPRMARKVLLNYSNDE